MNQKKWLWSALLALSLAVGGGVYATTLTRPHVDAPDPSEGYVCPITGEVLPCEKCCPLNRGK